MKKPKDVTIGTFIAVDPASMKPGDVVFVDDLQGSVTPLQQVASALKGSYRNRKTMAKKYTNRHIIQPDWSDVQRYYAREKSRHPYTIANVAGELIHRYDGSITWMSSKLRRPPPPDQDRAARPTYSFTIDAKTMASASDYRHPLMNAVQGMALQIQRDEKKKGQLDDIDQLEEEVAGWYTEEGK